MTKKLLALFMCMMAFVVFLCSCADEKTGIDTASKGTNITVYEVKKSDIVSTTEYSGTIIPDSNVSVSSKISAKAQTVSVKEGDYVSKGQNLLVLDKTDLNNSYNQAKASYNTAVANYNSVINSSTKQATAQADQAVKSAEISYEQAKTNYEREKTLYENSSNVKLAQQNYDTAKQTYEREKTLYENSSNVKLAQQNYDTAKQTYEREKTLYENSSNVKLAQQSYNDAKNSYDRIKQLFDIGGASLVELDSAKTAMISAEENLKTVQITASAAMDAAKAAMDTAKENLSITKTNASAAMDAAKATMDTAKENLSITKTNASAAMDAAKATFDNAKLALDNAKENKGLVKSANDAAIESANASVESARASLNTASSNLNSAVITAPISGYVSACNVSGGQMVSPGVELFSISNTNIVNAEFNVTESTISNLEIGSRAVIKVKAADYTDTETTVTMINPVKDSRTGLYKIRVAIDNSTINLKSGMLCDVELTLDEHTGIVKIPSEALIHSGKEYFVYIANDNKAKKVKVEIGITDEEYTEIKKGVKHGDKVVVTGKEYLSEKNNDINIQGEYKSKSSK